MIGRLKISLEFVRSEKSSDPYSFQFGVQKYLCRDATRHEYDELTLDWDEPLLRLLEQLQRPGQFRRGADGARAASDQLPRARWDPRP